MNITIPTDRLTTTYQLFRLTQFKTNGAKTADFAIFKTGLNAIKELFKIFNSNYNLSISASDMRRYLKGEIEEWLFYNL